MWGRRRRRNRKSYVYTQPGDAVVWAIVYAAVLNGPSRIRPHEGISLHEEAKREADKAREVWLAGTGNNHEQEDERVKTGNPREKAEGPRQESQAQAP